LQAAHVPPSSRHSNVAGRCEARKLKRASCDALTLDGLETKKVSGSAVETVKLPVAVVALSALSICRTSTV